MQEPRMALFLYHLLLKLYPAQFREDYEREVLAVFAREWLTQSSRFGALCYFVAVVAAALTDAPKEHLALLTSDLRDALRRSLRSPWFTFVAVATLALGMGVNSALFSVVKAVLLEKLPYGKPEQLVRVWIRNPKQGYEHDISNWPRLEDWRRAGCFQSVAGFTGARLILTGGADPLQLRGASVTVNFFSMMGVHPFVGHDFEAGDEVPGQPGKVILSYRLWLSRFGSDPAIAGSHLQLNGVSYEVAGVAPPEMRFPERDLDFWTPLLVDDRGRRARGSFWLNVAARLRDGVTLRQAQSEMDAYSRALAEQHPEDRDLNGVALVSLQHDLTGPIRPGLTILSGAVFFILLICCANIAGMLSARAAERLPELSIRAALGAGRGRVVRHLLTEAMLLFVLGGGAGIAAAYGGVALLLRLAPRELPQLQDAKLDLVVAACTLAVSGAAGLIFGLIPALQVPRRDLVRNLRQGERGVSGRLDSRRFRTALTIGEMALAMILLTGSWLLIRSFREMEQVAPGYDAHNVSIAAVQLPRPKYPDAQAIDFYTRLMDRLREAPGIESAAGITNFFLGRLPDSATFSIEGRSDKITLPLTTDTITTEFFSTMKIPLLRGRFFNASDRADSLPVVLINNTTAKRFWPGGDPIGHRITFGDPGANGTRWYTIVGVVGDTTRAGADQPVFPESYTPLAQNAVRGMEILIRGSDVRAALQAAVREVDPNQPVLHFSTLDAAQGDQTALRRFTTFLLTLFALTAAAITGVGLYGLISYLVTQRQKEFGIRFALGARAGDVFGIVIWRAVAMAGIGLALGSAGALSLSRLLGAMLFGVGRFDGASYLAAAGGLLLVCLVAAISPAIRAVRTDPLIAIRAE